MKKLTVLYFPGIHRLPNELEHFFLLLKEKTGASIYISPIQYDTGIFTLTPFYDWLNSIPRPDWWIGLSLGASLAWMAAAECPEMLRPARLTLLNPFANRKILAETAGFSMSNQWDLVPEQVEVPPGIKTDAVISRQDSKIPWECKRNLIHKIPKGQVSLIDTDHAFSSEQEQILLFKTLLHNA